MGIKGSPTFGHTCEWNPIWPEQLKALVPYMELSSVLVRLGNALFCDISLMSWWIHISSPIYGHKTGSDITLTSRVRKDGQDLEVFILNSDLWSQLFDFYVTDVTEIPTRDHRPSHSFFQKGMTSKRCELIVEAAVASGLTETTVRVIYLTNCVFILFNFFTSWELFIEP